MGEHERLVAVAAYIEGSALLARVYLAVTPTGLWFSRDPPPHRDVEGVALYTAGSRFADRLIAAATPKLAKRARYVGLAELISELLTIAETVDVRLMAESEVRVIARDAVERIEGEFAELWSPTEAK